MAPLTTLTANWDATGAASVDDLGDPAMQKKCMGGLQETPMGWGGGVTPI